MDKLTEQNFISEIHSKTDLTQYINAIFSDRKIGPVEFLSLANHCLEHTKTNVPAFKAFRRLERLWVLLKFLLFSLITTPDFAMIVFLIFGTSKLRNIGSDLGAAVKNFKDAVKNENTSKVKTARRGVSKTRVKK